MAAPAPIASRLAFLYSEHARLDVVDGAVAQVTADDGGCDLSTETALPLTQTSVLLLGPGTCITHAAVRHCADQGCLIQWVGEEGVRLYSAGRDRHVRLEDQARVVLDVERRLAAARRLYRRMTALEPPERATIESLRGWEGQWVAKRYQEIAAQYGVHWSRREAGGARPLDAALDTATSTLYGITEAVIVALGLSPALGIVHHGDPRSLVFDIADTVKFRTVVPVAFGVLADSAAKVSQETRRRCRDLFVRERLLEQLVDTTEHVLFGDDLCRGSL